MEIQLSRRALVAGGTMAGMAAAVGGAALPVREAAADEAASQAPSGYLCPEDWLGQPPVVDEGSVVDEVTVDVLVLGSGHAGTQAALAAVQEGASVAVVEKQDKDMYWCFGEDLGTFNSQFLTERGFGGYDLGEVVSEFMRRTGGNASADIVRLYVENSGEMLDNLVSILPEESTVFDIDGGQCIVQHCYGKESGADYPVEVGGLKSWATSLRTIGNVPDYPVDGREGVTRMTELEIDTRLAAEALGAVWYFGHEAVVLEQDETGRVTGALAKDPGGNYVRFNANKGVLLACGDFSGNAAMVYNLIDGVNEAAARMGKTADDLVSMGRDGSGIKMGCWAGGYLQSHPRPSMNNNSGVPGPFGTAPFLVLNVKGKRFYNEALSEYGSNCTWRQPVGLLAAVTDANYIKTVQGASADHGAPDWGAPSFLEAAQADMAKVPGSGAEGAPVTKCDILNVANPSTQVVYAGDTLEEVLGYLGYEGEALETALASIARYNELCAAGCDSDYGKDADLMIAIDTPPFYGFRGNNSGARGTGLVTVCGLVTDENLNVLGADHSTPIEGLYAAGNCLGQRYGATYVMPVAGNSIGMAMTHGRVAGRIIAGL